MEFYKLLEKIIGFIPSQYASIREGASIFLSIFLFICTAATCFFGNTVRKIWNVFFFFCIGFLLPVLLVDFIFNLKGVLYWILIAFGIACGVLCAVYSKRLFKVQIFVTAFLMVFIAVPSYISFLGGAIPVLIGFVCALTAALLGIKYKYLTLMVTTAFSGAFLMWSIIEGQFSLNSVLCKILAALTGVAGLVVQCIVEKDSLNDTYNHLKKRKNQVKKLASKKTEANGKRD